MYLWLGWGWVEVRLYNLEPNICIQILFFNVLLNPLMSTDKYKDRDHYIKNDRAEIKVEHEILNSFTSMEFPTLHFLIYKKNNVLFVSLSLMHSSAMYLLQNIIDIPVMLIYHVCFFSYLNIIQNIFSLTCVVML